MFLKCKRNVLIMYMKNNKEINVPFVKPQVWRSMKKSLWASYHENDFTKGATSQKTKTDGKPDFQNKKEIRTVTVPPGVDLMKSCCFVKGQKMEDNPDISIQI